MDKPETIEIVDGFRLVHRRHGGPFRIPMRGHAQDGLGLRDRIAELAPGLRVLVALQRIHGAAMAEEHDRHSGSVALHRGCFYARSNRRTSASFPLSSTISAVSTAFPASPTSSGPPFTVKRPRATGTHARPVGG